MRTTTMGRYIAVLQGNYYRLSDATGRRTTAMILMIDNQHQHLAKSNAIQSNYKKPFNSIANSPREINLVYCRPR